jgi:hypothetical protein
VVGGHSIEMGDSSRGAGGDSSGDTDGLRFRRLGGGEAEAEAEAVAEGGVGGVSVEVTRLRPIERADFRTGCNSWEEGLVSLSAMTDESLV